MRIPGASASSCPPNAITNYHLTLHGSGRPRLWDPSRQRGGIGGNSATTRLPALSVENQAMRSLHTAMADALRGSSKDHAHR
jgi:hypothetical protein